MPTVTIQCEGLTDVEGSSAPAEILEEFSARPWHSSVQCNWHEGKLTLTASNDFDAEGQALLDDFWDAVHATINYSGPVRFSIVDAQP